MGEERALGLRGVDEAHGHLRQNSERAFAADEDVAQGIAGDVLHAFVARGDRRAVGQDAGDPHDVVARHAVFEAAQAAGVFRHVAADRGDRLGTGVGGIEEALRGDGVEEVEGDDARLDRCRKVFLVDLQDAVHPGHADDHAALDGGAAAGKSGAGPPGNDGEPLLSAEVHGEDEVLLRLRIDDDVRNIVHFRGRVVSQNQKVLLFRVDVFPAEPAGEMIDSCLADHTALPPF